MNICTYLWESNVFLNDQKRILIVFNAILKAHIEQLVKKERKQRRKGKKGERWG